MIVELVFGDGAGLEGGLEFVHRVLAGTADAHAALFGHVLDDLHEVAPALLGELGDGQADDASVVRGIDAELGLAQGAVDILHDRGIVRLHREHARLGRGDEGDLFQRHRRAVGMDVHVDVVEEGGTGLAGADAGHLRGNEVGGFLHRFFGFEQEGFEVHGGLKRESRRGSGQINPQAQTTVPMSSPVRARRMLPSIVMSKTTMGMALS